MESRAAEDLPVDDALTVGRNQALHGKTDAEDLLIAELAGVLELQDMGTDILEVRIRWMEVHFEDRAMDLLPVEVDGDDLDQVAQELHANADAVLRLDGIGARLSSDDFALELACLMDETFFLQGIEVCRDGRTTQMKVIGNILLRDSLLLIDVLVDSLAIRLADLRWCDTLLHWEWGSSLFTKWLFLIAVIIIAQAP